MNSKTQITLDSSICANGETIEWTLRAGQSILVSYFTTKKLSKEKAFSILIGKIAAYNPSPS